jgi:hypothetical protein
MKRTLHVTCEEERCIQGFGRENLRERTTWKTQTDLRIILKWILGSGMVGHRLD